MNIDSKICHLQMIQSAISRMASNSFALKGWSVTLVAGIFALAGKDTDKMYFLVSYVPIIVFWGLDSYYLLQERRYRSLYNNVRNIHAVENIDFSLSATKSEYRKDGCNYWSCLMSPTEIGLYLPLALLCSAIIIINQNV